MAVLSAALYAELQGQAATRRVDPFAELQGRLNRPLELCLYGLGEA